MTTVGRQLANVVPQRLEKSLRRAQHSLYWYVARNPGSRQRFTAQHPPIGQVQQRLIQELRTRGISFVEVPEIGLEDLPWQRLVRRVQEFADSEQVRTGIRQFREGFGQADLPSDAYIIKLYPEGPTLAFDDPLLQLALRGPMLDVVNSYLGLWSKLIYTDVWHTVPVDPGGRIGSQYWHRDPEDRRMVKVFLYLSQVDSTAGPMEYLVGSAVGGPHEGLWRWKPYAQRGHRYPPEEEVERRAPAADRVTCTGSVGSMIFCDTSGLHRGTVATERPRILATWTFVTPASLGVTARRRFSLSADPRTQGLSAAAQFALA
jgi:hypothetical protein